MWIRCTWLPWRSLGVVQPPGSAGGHGTRTSRDLDGLVRSCCWPGGTVAQLQVIASSMAGAGQLVAGNADPVHQLKKRQGGAIMRSTWLLR